MPRFAANLTMMFNEVPFLDRFEAAAKAGFTAVEFLFPYEHPAGEIGSAGVIVGDTAEFQRHGFAPAYGLNQAWPSVVLPRGLYSQPTKPR